MTTPLRADVSPNIHKLLLRFISRVLDKSLIIDAQQKEVETRKLRQQIENLLRQTISQKEFSNFLTQLTESGYELLKQNELLYKIAGLYVLDCLIDINEEMVTDRRIIMNDVDTSIGSGNTNTANRGGVGGNMNNNINNINNNNNNNNSGNGDDAPVAKSMIRVDIANHLRKIFENNDVKAMGIETGSVILRICAQLIGHLARIASITETEYLQSFYYPVAMKLLKGEYNSSGERGVVQKLSGCVILKELAMHLSATIYSNRQEVFASLWEVVCDKSAVVRDAGAESLQECLFVVSQRESMHDWITAALSRVEKGFENSKISEKIIGSLLILDIVIGGVVVPNQELLSIMKSFGRKNPFSDLIDTVLELGGAKDSVKDVLVLEKVINIIPQLAAAFTQVFTKPSQYSNPDNYLIFSIKYLIQLIQEKQRTVDTVTTGTDGVTVKVSTRSIAYKSLGKLVTTMCVALRNNGNVISDIIEVIKEGFTRDDFFCSQALHCLGSIVNSVATSRMFVNDSLIEHMFRDGLTFDLIDNLKILMKQVPLVRQKILSLLLTHIKSILKSHDVSLVEGPRRSKDHIEHGENSVSLFGSSSGKNQAPVKVKKRNSIMTNSNIGEILGFSKTTEESTTKRSYLNPFSRGSNLKSSTTSAADLPTNNPLGFQDTSRSQHQHFKTYADSQLILAMQILSSSDFFSREISSETLKFNDNSNDYFKSNTSTKHNSIVSSVRTKDRGKSVISATTGGNRKRHGSLESSDRSERTASDSHTVLLRTLSESVVRFLDDYSPDVRAAAIVTCTNVLDTSIGQLIVNSEESIQFSYILSKVLSLGVGDDLTSIRSLAFQSLPSSLDRQVAESENLHCIIQATNDENTAVRIAAMEVLSRLAQHDPIHVMPTLRLMLHRLLLQLQNFTSTSMEDDNSHHPNMSSLININYSIANESQSQGLKLRLESVQLLQAIVRGASTLIAPYVDQILEALVPLLNDSYTPTARSALSTIAELSVSSPAALQHILDNLFHRLIVALNDVKSVENQETAVEAMGKLVSSLALVTEEPYTRYPGLFEGLVGIIQSDLTSDELRMKTIQTTGLLGAVESSVYKNQMKLYKRRKNMTSSTDIEEIDIVELDVDIITSGGNDNSKNTKANNNTKNVTKTKARKPSIDTLLLDLEEKEINSAEKAEYLERYISESKERKISTTEIFYLKVVIEKLVKILYDSTLPQHHVSASQVVMKILRIFGPQAHFLVGTILKAISFRLFNRIDGDNNLITVLLDQVMTTVLIMGRLLRQYIPDIVIIMKNFFGSHVRNCMNILESMALKFPFPDFNIVFLDVLPVILRKLQNEIKDHMKTYAETQDNTQSYASSLFGAITGGMSSSNTDPNTSNNLPQTTTILKSMTNMLEIFSDHHKRIIIPSILQVLDYDNADILITRQQALWVAMALVNNEKLSEYANQIVLPLMRILDDLSHEKFILQKSAVTALSLLVCRMDVGFIPFIIPVRRKLDKLMSNLKTKNIEKIAEIDEYENLVTRLLEHRPLPREPIGVSDMYSVLTINEGIRKRAKNARLKMEDGGFQTSKFSTLEQAWALAGRNNSADLVEWMNRLAAEFIRQSPSPIIRTCAELCKSHKPLADGLFTISFKCIWDELFVVDSSDIIDSNSLISSIELALRSPHINTSMMTSLLNLAEFMDMQDKRLPLNVKLLARSAADANMYSKALRYREIQFNSKNIDPDKECIKSLITVNNQLGARERALGVINHVQGAYKHIAVEPSWLEKLEKWKEAKESYVIANQNWRKIYPNGSPTRYPVWLANELGILRCSYSLGEYKSVFETALDLHEHLIGSDGAGDEDNTVAAEVQRLGAHSSWMLQKWDDMAFFLENDIDEDLPQSSAQQVVDVTNSTSFYRTVLAIHKENYSTALDLIDGTRSYLAGTISSLLTEGYTRAYPAMVTMQILSELEEIVDYKQAVAAINSSYDQDREDLKRIDEQYGLGRGNNAFNTGVGVGGSYDDTRQSAIDNRKETLIRKWKGRLKWAPKEVPVYMQILAVHLLVINPQDDLESWLELVKLCRDGSMDTLCENLLRRLGAPMSDISEGKLVSTTSEVEDSGINTSPEGKRNKSKISSDPEKVLRIDSSESKVVYSMLKYMWHSGDSVAKEKALSDLSIFVKQTGNDPFIAKITSEAKRKNSEIGTISIHQLAHNALLAGTITSQAYLDIFDSAGIVNADNGKQSRNNNNGNNTIDLSSLLTIPSVQSDAQYQKYSEDVQESIDFRVQMLLKRAEWMRELSSSSTDYPLEDLLDTVMQARNIAECRHKVWHAWAVTNYDQLQKLSESRNNQTNTNTNTNINTNINTNTNTNTNESNDMNSKSNNNLNSQLFPEDNVGANSTAATTTAAVSTSGASTTPGNAKKMLRRYSHSLVNRKSIVAANVSTDIAVALKEAEIEENITSYACEAIKGFVRSIILGHSNAEVKDFILQDTLRLLTLWLEYGTKREVESIAKHEIERIAPDCWLGVLPQLIARMYVKSPEISKILQALLLKVATRHPQALVCPISVARNTQNDQQKKTATYILNEMCKSHSQLVEEATMVSRELMRAAISPQELWKEKLEEAYSLYMGRDEDGNFIQSYAERIARMLQTLTNMHEAMDETTYHINDKEVDELGFGFSESAGNIGSVTLRDISFRQNYGRELSIAYDLLNSFKETGLTSTLHELWELYFRVIQRTEINIIMQKKVHLHHVSKQLTSSRNLMLCVPGTYKPNAHVVSIAKFVNTLNIIVSKQRPRRLAMLGSDGKTYEFLLKGKEDLRQDERVMQLFELINLCLEEKNSHTSGLSIVTYSVLPLSNNSGLIGWVQNCDTFASLLSNYRSERGIPLTLEPMLLRNKMGGGNHIRKYDQLPSLSKVEIFESILEDTQGRDLEIMLWLKSKTADVWVERRANFTRSMAVMSMVGYIFGLGDRHMANIMLDRVSGRVIHIDFGDCFEVNRTRAMYPETIPFRLTRMLTNAMGTSGMAGTFRITSYRVMRVLHENRDSVMAMLEAFVYDPMVSWRVLAAKEEPQTSATTGSGTGTDTDTNESTGKSVIDSKINHPNNLELDGTLKAGAVNKLLNNAVANLIAGDGDSNGNDDDTYDLLDNFGNDDEIDRHLESGLLDDKEVEKLLSKQSMTLSHTFFTKRQPQQQAIPQKMISLATTRPINPADHIIRASVGTLSPTLSRAAMNNIVSTADNDISGNAGGVIVDPTAIAEAMGTLLLKPGQQRNVKTNSVNVGITNSTTQNDNTNANTNKVNDDEFNLDNINVRALDIISRIHSKLTGKDFNAIDDDDSPGLDINQQVDRLILEATSNENLASLYTGWNPWW